MCLRIEKGTERIKQKMGADKERRRQQERDLLLNENMKEKKDAGRKLAQWWPTITTGKNR